MKTDLNKSNYGLNEISNFMTRMFIVENWRQE